jgi:phosphoglycolate phosphatase
MRWMPLPENQSATFRPAGIVWDLDGTLVESAPDLATALNALLFEHGQQGHTVETVRTMIGAGVAKLIERGFRSAGSPLSESERDALVPRFMELYTGCATDSTHLIPHAREALEHFYHSGIKQGLCTNKPYGVTRQILNALDINGFFGSVIGGDSTPAKKPDPAPLLACLEELGLQPNEAVMIGDSGADVGAARAAGVPIILVPDGYTGAPADTLGADYVIESLVKIPETAFPASMLQQTA